MDLTIVIPAYNEATRLPPTLDTTLKYLNDRKLKFEILVVNDGSKDMTAAVVNAYSARYDNVKLINLECNSGKGCAIRTGVLQGSGKRILFADADGSTPIKELERLEQSLKKGYDLAIGSRAAPSEETNIKTVWYRKLLGRIFNLYVNMIILPGFADTQCGFKLFSNESAKFIFSHQKADGFSFDIEILFLARRAGLEIAEVPVNWNNVAGSKVNLVVDALKMMRDCLIFRLWHRKISPRSFENFLKE